MRKNKKQTVTSSTIEFLTNVKYPDRKSKFLAIKSCISRIRSLRSIEYPDKYEKNRLTKAIRSIRKNISDLNGLFSEDQWREIVEISEMKCAKCGKKKPLYKDHIIPIGCVGSSNHVSNIQPLCWDCNSSKGRNAKDYRSDFIKEIFSINGGV
jgi:5-methylcytosine-specific restriction endonuclease McrA